MNVLFSLLFFVCTFLLLCTSPDTFLSSLLDGASRGASISVALIANYTVWLGLMRVWEDSGVTKGVSKLLRPLVKRLFLTEDEEALRAVSMNLSVNLLGISGAATPYGIRCAKLLDKTPHAEYASAMLFVLNATSLQLIPTSIVSVRVGMQSANPYDIILPTLFATLLSTLFGVLLTWVFLRPKTKATQPVFSPSFKKTKGVSMR